MSKCIFYSLSSKKEAEIENIWPNMYVFHVGRLCVGIQSNCRSWIGIVDTFDIFSMAAPGNWFCHSFNKAVRQCDVMEYFIGLIHVHICPHIKTVYKKCEEWKWTFAAFERSNFTKKIIWIVPRSCLNYLD